ncbi:MAG: hypothetical protein QF755_00750 [Candidatus Peribacteraceae bacterium]|nr:hypothetical protein [Candidatus Peribacteraceae bacterium]
MILNNFISGKLQGSMHHRRRNYQFSILNSQFLRILSYAILLVIFVVPQQASSQMYNYIHDISRKEFLLDKKTDGLDKFILKKQVFDFDPSLKKQDVVDAFSYMDVDICDRRKEFPCSIGDPIRTVGRREEMIKTLSRDLQMVVAGYEMPITDHIIKPMYLAPRYSSIIGIMQSSNDWLMTPVVEKRVFAMSWDKAKKEVKKANVLGLMGDSKRMWSRRYQWGVASVMREDPNFTDCKAWKKEWDKRDTSKDTELTYLRARNCKLEEKLYDAWVIAKAELESNVDYEDGQVVLSAPIKISDDIFIWIQPNEIGTGLYMPYKPLFPKIVTNGNPILGGRYAKPPIEPLPYDKMCAMPFSSRGYLCRPVDDAYCPSPEKEKKKGAPPPKPKNEIVLTACNPDHLKGVIRSTEAGVDACEVGGWRTNPVGYKRYDRVADKYFIDAPGDTPAYDSDVIDKPYHCGNCAIDMYCDGEGDIKGAPDSGNCSKGYALSFDKLENGILPICLPKELPSLSHLLIHELVHAQQKCNLPPFTSLNDTKEKCCASEVPAYTAQCNALAEDGNLIGTGLSVTLCASVLSNMSCLKFAAPDPKDKKKKIPPCSDDAISMDKIDEVVEFMKKEVFPRNAAGRSTKCEDLIEESYQQFDKSGKPMPGPAAKSRTAAQISSLPQVCTPECISEYRNTIGNNMCYLAQCIEQSIEEQRILPSRWTFVTQGQSFPWDSETKPDPLIGAILPTPPLPFSRLPDYRPQRLTIELDLALCQQNGLPLQQIPIECAFKVIRQLAIAPTELPMFSSSILRQTVQESSVTWGLQTSAPAIGTRVATGLYKKYLSYAGKAFAELINSANIIFGGLANIEFPTLQCPRK